MTDAPDPDATADRPLTRRELRRRRDGRPAATILTVCTGNICRSPMAEVLLRAALEAAGVRVHSAGTHAMVGHGMTEESQEIAIAHGADPEVAAAHRARYLVEPLLAGSDLVLTMTREQRSHVVQLLPAVLRRTFTVREFARLAASLSDAELRPDPTADPDARLQALARTVGAQRGLVEGAPQDDDVIDPYRRGREVYEQAAAQLLPALDEVERAVRLALR